MPNSRSQSLRCRTCHYWQHIYAEEGICRRHAPAPSGRTYPSFAFPSMFEDQWCGDHFYVGDQRPACARDGSRLGSLPHPQAEPWAPAEGVMAKLMLGPVHNGSRLYPWADSLDEPDTGLDV